MSAAEKLPASGYFRVPLAAARAIVSASDDLDLLAGYIVLREGAYDKGRRLTACGAKAIRTYTGCTEWRSLRIMDDLRSLCFGDRGESWLIRDTGTKLGNAAIYEFGDWPGPDAYLPSLLVKSKNQLPARLHTIRSRESLPEVKRDALLLLCHLYAMTDYAGWMGAPPDYFVHQLWDISGSRDNMELGHCDDIGEFGLWMVAPPIDGAWSLPSRLHRELFAEGAQVDAERIWQALWFLLRSGAVCKVAVVSDRSRTYPLWVFSPAYRDALMEGHGLRCDLAADFQRLAGATYADPDNYVIIAATSPDRHSEGTGIFFCAAKSTPIVRTLLIPRVHAPTPMNLSGLTEAAEISADWARRIHHLRAKAKAA